MPTFARVLAFATTALLATVVCAEQGNGASAKHPISVSMLGTRDERPGWWVIGIDAASQVTGYSDSHSLGSPRALVTAEHLRGRGQGIEAVHGREPAGVSPDLIQQYRGQWLRPLRRSSLREGASQMKLAAGSPFARSPRYGALVRDIVTIGGLPNNGLHQTGRGGAVASRPVVEARPAGEPRCWTDAPRAVENMK
jgi:hypothetical protein